MSLRAEIAEQPRVVRRLLDEGWPESRTLGHALSRVEHITLVARGSSDNAATYGKYLFESIAGVVTALAAPSLVTRYQAPPSYARGAVIGISQSGASPDVAAVVAEGRRAGAVTIGITNQPRSALGRGYLYPAAPGSALKVKELARIWAEPYSSADFAHGPRTLLRSRTPVVLLASRGATQAESRALVSSLAEKGARVYAITNDERVAERARDAIMLRAPLSEPLVPISFVVAGQQRAVALARRHGRDPERPAGLAKVTRTL